MIILREGYQVLSLRSDSLLMQGLVISPPWLSRLAKSIHQASVDTLKAAVRHDDDRITCLGVRF